MDEDEMIIGTLCWFNEPVAFLDRCVRSLGSVVDHLLAVDGRWKHCGDGLPARSPEQEYETIREAAIAIGLPCTIVGPNIDARTGEPVPWQSQVEKRARICDIAVALGADWVLVIDGDEWVMRAGDFRAQLEETDRYVAYVDMIRTTGCRPGDRSQSGRVRRLFYTASGLTVDRAHNGYRTLEEPPRWLQGDSAYVKLEKALDLSKTIALGHAYGARGGEREALRMDFRMRRRDKLLERWAA
jgi:hypothetical protein